MIPIIISFIKKHSNTFFLVVAALLVGMSIGEHMNAHPTTATFNVTPSPTVLPLVLEQQVAEVVQEAAAYPSQYWSDSNKVQSISFDPATNSVVVPYDFSSSGPIDSGNMTINRIQADSFGVFQAIYSSPVASSLQGVMLTYTTDMSTSAGTYTTGLAGKVLLTSNTEKQLSWYSLNANSAWSHYDSAWLNPALSNGN